MCYVYFLNVGSLTETNLSLILAYVFLNGYYNYMQNCNFRIYMIFYSLYRNWVLVR